MALVNIHHRVSSIAQQDNNYCWACAFAMILGRRTWAAALELADRCPANARDPHEGTILNPSLAARAVGLSCERITAFTPHFLARHMARHAVVILGRYNTGRRDYNHVMVVSTLSGDDQNPSSFTVGVHDTDGDAYRCSMTWDRWYGPGRILRRADWIVYR